MDEEDLTVFPQSVHLVTKPRRVGTSDIVKIGFLAWIAAMIFISIIAISFFKSRGFPVYIYWVSAVSLNVIILTTIWRYFVFDENMRKQEMLAQGTFNRYCRIRGLSPSKVWDRIGDSLPIFEYNNGGCFIVIKFAYGSNTTTKSAGNELFFQEILREIHSKNMGFSEYVMTEEFKHSREATQHLEKLSECEEPTLASSASRLVKAVFDVASEYSNTEVVYFLVKGKSKAYHEVLLMFTAFLEKQLMEFPTSFRSVTYGDEKDYTRLLKEHYKLPVIDGARIRVDDLEEEGSGNKVEIFKVIADDGEVKYNRDLIPKHVHRIKRIN